MNAGDSERPVVGHPSGDGAGGREAILFVPGVVQESADQSVEGVAMRLAAAMDRNAETVRAKFRVGDVRDAEFGAKAPVRVATIFREDDGAEEAVADVYHVAYSDFLLEKYRNAMPWLAILRVILTLIPMSARLLTPRRERVVTWKERLQMGLAFILLILLAVYLVVLCWALIATVAQLQALGEPPADPGSANDDSEPVSFRSKVSEWATLGALVLTALGFVLPTRTEVRQRLTDAATLVIALALYFQAGKRQKVLSGWLHAVLQRIQELEGVHYAKVRIIAYSFGSIMTLDTLFPDSDSQERVPERVDSLVTIGSPFDFVQLFWPRYFENRRALAGLQWVNIYAPEDVLSSNFRSHSKAVSASRTDQAERAGEARVLSWMEPPENVQYRLRVGRDELAWWEPFLFVGLRSHSMYWEPDDSPHLNVYDAAVVRLYGGHRVLR